MNTIHEFIERAWAHLKHIDDLERDCLCPFCCQWVGMEELFDDPETRAV